MSEEWIECYHPEAGVSATFSRRAYEEVWKDLGWLEGLLPEPEGGSGDPDPEAEEAAEDSEVVEEDLFDEE